MRLSLEAVVAPCRALSTKVVAFALVKMTWLGAVIERCVVELSILTLYECGEVLYYVLT